MVLGSSPGSVKFSLPIFQINSKFPVGFSLVCSIRIEKAASTLCDPRAAVARFTTISCLHLNERGGAIPGDIWQLMVELLLTGAPTLAKTG